MDWVSAIASFAIYSLMSASLDAAAVGQLLSGVVANATHEELAMSLEQDCTFHMILSAH